MINAADQHIRIVQAGAAMRPRRWYTDEIAPPCRVVKLNAELWRYRALVRRAKRGTAPELKRRRTVLRARWARPSSV